MESLLVYYNGIILFNAILISVSFIIVIPTAFHTRAPPGVEIIQILYSLIVMVISYGSIFYQIYLHAGTCWQTRRAKVVYTIERILTAQAFVCLLNSIAVTYRASFLEYQAPAVFAFLLSWFATLSAGVGRFTLRRHPWLKFEAVKKFVEDDEPLPEMEDERIDDVEMNSVSSSSSQLPQIPPPTHSR